MLTEQKPHRLDPNELSTRNKWRNRLRVIIKSERHPYSETSGIQKLVEHRRKTGMGAIVFANHFDRVDPIVVAEQMCASDPELASAELVIPIADHQKMDIIHLRGIAKQMTTHLMPIVSENSIQKYKKRIRSSLLAKIGPVSSSPNIKKRLESELPELNTGRVEFVRKVAEAVISGALVYYPTEAERSSDLRYPEEKGRNLASFIMLLKKQLRKNGVDVNDVGLICVGVSLNIPNKVTNYEKQSGFNIGKMHRANIGSFTTVGNAIKSAGGDIHNLDAWTITHGVAPLVDRNHLSPKLRIIVETHMLEKIASEE